MENQRRSEVSGKRDSRKKNRANIARFFHSIGKKICGTAKLLLLFGQGMMVKTDYASDFPYPIFVLPYLNKLRFTDRLCFFLAGMMKTMYADLNRAVTLQRVNLKRS